MAESAFPFDAGPGANVLENSWQKMAREWLATGVISGRLNQLAVSADGSALSVSIASGQAQVEGFFYENDAALSKTLATANATNPRIDTVVVRLDRTANTAALAVLTGTAAAAPTAPALTQTDTLYELPLADVRVPAAAGVIASSNVTDRRVYTKNLTAAGANAAYGTKPAGGAAISAVETTTSTSYVDLATVQEITHVAASDRAHVGLISAMSNSATARCWMSFDVIRDSDSVVVAAAQSSRAIWIAQATSARLSGFVIVDGLTPGVLYRFRTKYRVDSGTGTFQYRTLTVES